MLRKFLNINGLALAIFMYAGLFKGDVYFEWVPFDFTLIISLIVIMLMLISLVKYNLNVPKTTFKIIGVYLLFLIPIFWTELSDYAIRKIAFMFTITFLAMVSPIILIKNTSDLNKLFNALLVITVILCIDSAINYIKNPNIFTLEAFSADYISLGRICGVSVLWLFCILMHEKRFKQRLLLLALIAFILAITVGAGGRGPVVSLMICIFIISAFNIIIKKNYIFIGLICVFVSLVLTFSLSIAPRGSSWRIMQIAKGRVDIMHTGRPEMFLISINDIIVNPLGTGWGGYERVSTGFLGTPQSDFTTATRYYPHNLILEAFVEGGWLVGIAIIFLLGISIYWMGKLFFTNYILETQALFIILVYLLIGAMFSGDWNDNRDLFAIVALSLFFGKEHVRLIPSQ